MRSSEPTITAAEAHHGTTAGTPVVAEIGVAGMPAAVETGVVEATGVAEMAVETGVVEATGKRSVCLSQSAQ